MRALLDTNIIIHRESMQATNYSIVQLYYWLDKLHYEKLIYPYSVQELRKSGVFGYPQDHDGAVHSGVL